MFTRGYQQLTWPPRRWEMVKFTCALDPAAMFFARAKSKRDFWGCNGNATCGDPGDAVPVHV
jgi:hypothetical protein